MEADQQFSWHNLDIEKAMEKLSAKEQGLTADEVQKRQEKYGKNVLPEKGGKNVILLFLKQFKDFLILILLIAAGIAWWADHMADVYIILAVILFNAIMGFTQEYKAEKAVKAIKNMVKKRAWVLRDGRETEVEVEDIVPGDIIVLKEGSTIPADGRLIKAKNLHTEEASLTGESMPVDKKIDSVEEDAPVADRTNMVFKTTNISRGAGRAVVTATGTNSEIGKIATSMSKMKKQDSNFKNKTAKLGKQMAVIAVATAAIVFAIGFLIREFEFEEILLVTIATLVSSIPEGLPVVISIVLAIGAKRMANQKAIIREFTATEMMGSVSTILTDKTGTITQSILTVKKAFTGNGSELDVSGTGYELQGEFKKGSDKKDPLDNPVEQKLMAIAELCNNASLELESNQVSGDPTEAAMLVMGRKSKIREKASYQNHQRLDDLPFNSEQKFRASLVDTGERTEIFVIGAPEKILELSNKWLGPNGPEEMTEEKRAEIREKIDTWTGEAMRVLSQAYRPSGNRESVEVDDVKELIWTGITGIIDPPRQGVKESIKECKTAGIRVIMVTGDHKRTAAAIAEQVGIINSSEEKKGDKYPVALTSKELDLDDEEFDEMIENVSVFARVDPQTKLRIAERLQAKNTLIAMTGDGVNDAPALKRADVGIAMGIKGTDVAKDAAKIVLQDDNFSNIVNAIREGRIVFENVKKTSYFLITTNFAQTSVLIFGLLLGFPLPLTAAMILFVNLITDGIMDVALATEPGHGKIMQQPPVKKNVSILHWDIVPFLLIMALMMVTISLLTFKYYLPQGVEMARAGAFLVIAATQIFNAFNLRSLKESSFKIGFFSNKWITAAMIVSLLMQVVVIKTPFFRDLFGFGNLAMPDFLIIIAISSLVLAGSELYKYILHRTNIF